MSTLLTRRRHLLCQALLSRQIVRGGNFVHRVSCLNNSIIFIMFFSSSGSRVLVSLLASQIHAPPVCIFKLCSAMPPPLPSRPLGVRMLGAISPTVVVEVFHDLCCPFSKTLCSTLGSEAREGAVEGDQCVFEKIREHPILSSSVEFVYHNVPQPWHPQSAVMHESMFAVSCVVDHDPMRVGKYINAAYASFDSFVDKKMRSASRTDIHEMCADVASEALGGLADDELGGADVVRAKVLSYLDLSQLTDEEPHIGIGEVTDIFKFAVKNHRKRGVHVTPTVFVNGIEATDISSSWSADQWIEKLSGVVDE